MLRKEYGASWREKIQQSQSPHAISQKTTLRAQSSNQKHIPKLNEADGKNNSVMKREKGELSLDSNNVNPSSTVKINKEIRYEQEAKKLQTPEQKSNPKVTSEPESKPTVKNDANNVSNKPNSETKGEESISNKSPVLKPNEMFAKLKERGNKFVQQVIPNLT